MASTPKQTANNRFRGTITGNRGTASRLGRTLEATVNGWRAGVKVTGGMIQGTPSDEFHIMVSAGSGPPIPGSGSAPVWIGYLTEGEIRGIVAGTHKARITVQPIDSTPAPRYGGGYETK